MTLKFGYKEWFALVISILILVDLTTFLNVPFLRQILGFLFLAILPGVLILQILKLNKIGYTEKFVLSVRCIPEVINARKLINVKKYEAILKELLWP